MKIDCRCQRTLPSALAILGVLCLCNCTLQKDQKESERYILQSERQWAESVATGNTSAIERILAEDFVGVDPKGGLYNKQQMIDETRNAPKYFVSNRLNDVKVRFYGNTAIAQGSETWEKRFRRAWAFCLDRYVAAAQRPLANRRCRRSDRGRRDRLAQFEKPCSHRPVAGPVGRAVLCPPPAILQNAVLGVTHGTLTARRAEATVDHACPISICANRQTSWKVL